MNIGVFAADPGGSTGLAWGIFDPSHKDGVAGMLGDRLNAGSATVTGDERTQIREISGIWGDFFNACVRSALLPPERMWFACEDFIFSSGVAYHGKSASISTALIWGIEGYRMGRADQWYESKRGQVREKIVPPMILQTAGQAKGYATNQRLKEWGIWVVGREHERSAWQHIAYFLKKYESLKMT